jgi:hypothetical protein
MTREKTSSDARAHQRGSLVQRESPGDADDEVVIDHDVRGVATLGERAVLVDGAVREGVALQAVLLLAPQAGRALPAGVDHAADADAVTDGVPGDLGAGLGDDAGDFMAGDHGIGGRTPLAAHVVDVRVADTDVLDLDQDVVRADVPSLDGRGGERFGRGRRGVGGNGEHVVSPVRSRVRAEQGRNARVPSCRSTGDTSTLRHNPGQSHLGGVSAGSRSGRWWRAS